MVKWFRILLCDPDYQATAAGSQCCKDHPELGVCIPGEHDRHGSETLPDGKCWTYCINALCDAGKCSDQHKCHCACWLAFHILFLSIIFQVLSST